jgi:D-alanyl-lipoteichoic acid acyltransferase DltB (MBOAT superfamily)
MLFNSIEFIFFLPTVFVLYWFILNRNLYAQNFFIVCVSYVFYGWWDWRFLSLLILSTTVDYFIGKNLEIQKNETGRKLLLGISLTFNLGLLCFFKYFNFFIDSFTNFSSMMGIKCNTISISVILPVGISFYTFQSLSYTIDVYKKKIKSARNIVAFAAYVSFFPQLVAGPIERASKLLPQFYCLRVFDEKKAVDGLRQILWGLFKKIVIADNCAIFVNMAFSNTDSYSGGSLFTGVVLFAFQIYCDFSGYSDIAIGTSKLFGFSLMKNFAFPYFSRDIAEFWRRWHISLTTWFRDYIYIPLGGSKCNRVKQVRNVMIVFIVSGLWHGANWTFIIWGFLNALFFLPLLLLRRNRYNLDIIGQGRIIPKIGEFMAMVLTFGMTLIAWIFFRSPDVAFALKYLATIFSPSLFRVPVFFSEWNFKVLIEMLCFFIIIEWLGRTNEYAIERLNEIKSYFLRYGIYYFIVFLIIVFGNYQKNPFIYFQF